VDFAAERAVPVAVEVTFLRMDRPPEGPRPATPPGAQVVVAERCTVGFYRYLYDGVGRHHVWWLRRTLADEQLAGILGDPANSVHVLMHEGEPAGFYELDRRNRPVVNLSYFGLLPHALGNDRRPRRVRAWKDHGELLAAEASGEVVFASARRVQGLGHGAKGLVSLEVTVGVVVQLEAVHVDEEERQLVARRLVLLPGEGEVLVERGPVGDPRQPVPVQRPAQDAVGDTQVGLDASAHRDLLAELFRPLRHRAL